MIKKRKLTKNVEIFGYGINSNKKIKLTLAPSNGKYLKFLKNNFNNSFELSFKNYHKFKRTSSIYFDDKIIFGPEHIFGILFLFNIHDICFILDNSSEFPIYPINIERLLTEIDFSSEFVLSESNSDKLFNNLEFSEGIRFYSVKRANYFQVELTQDFPGGNQSTIKLDETHIGYANSISTKIIKAKSYIQKQKYYKMLSDGLFLGVNKTWCNIIEDDSVFLDDDFCKECARHKMLDFLGDLYLLNTLPKLKIKLINPNHRLNIQLLHMLMNNRISL